MLGVLLSFLSRGRGAVVVGEVGLAVLLKAELGPVASSVVVMTVTSCLMTAVSSTTVSLLATEGPGTILSSTCMTGWSLIVERPRQEKMYSRAVFASCRVRGCCVLCLIFRPGPW